MDLVFQSKEVWFLHKVCVCVCVCGGGGHLSQMPHPGSAIVILVVSQTFEHGNSDVTSASTYLVCMDTYFFRHSPSLP